MAVRPPNYLEWVPSNDPLKVVEPPLSFRANGWQPGMAPPAQYTNWQMYLVDQWIKYLDDITNNGAPDQSMRLLNGGYWSFDAVTGAFAWSLPFNVSIPGIPDSSNQAAAGGVVLADGDIAYVDINEPYYAQGDTDGVTNQITNMSGVAGIAIGMVVTGPGIPAATTVIGIGVDSVSLSNPTTSVNLQATYSFAAAGALAVQVAAGATFIPSLDTIIVAKRSGPKVYVGINTGQMVLFNGESKRLLGPGYVMVYEGVAGETLVKGDLVYVSSGAADSGRTAGSLYLLDASVAGLEFRSKFAGVCVDDAPLAGDPVNILMLGLYPTTGLLPGETYYADPAVPGGMVTPEPVTGKVIPIGLALTTTLLAVLPPSGSGSATVGPIFGYDRFASAPGQTDFVCSATPEGVEAVEVYVDGALVSPDEYTLFGDDTIRFNVAFVGVQDVELDYVLADQAFLTRRQEIPNNTGDNLNFDLTGSPMNQDATKVFVDGLYLPKDEWGLSYVDGHGRITLDVALAPGQTIACSFDSALEDGKPIVYGIPQSITFNPTTPLQIDQVAREQTIRLLSSGGNQLVTANPAIAPGAFIGQKVYLMGENAVDTYEFNGVAGVYTQGINSSGNVVISNNQMFGVMWDGTGWYEISRRV